MITKERYEEFVKLSHELKDSTVWILYRGEAKQASVFEIILRSNIKSIEDLMFNCELLPLRQVQKEDRFRSSEESRDTGEIVDRIFFTKGEATKALMLKENERHKEALLKLQGGLV